MNELSAHAFSTALGPAALAHGPRGLVAFALPAQTEAATRRGLETVVARRHLCPGGAEGRGAEGLRWQGAPTGEMAEAVNSLRRALDGDAVDLAGIELDLRNLSPFACLVYLEAQRIPRGEVRTYGELAASVGRPTAARAVGSAMAHNPFIVVVPCHRVVGGRGDLHGFSAPGGLRTKAALLAMEATVGTPAERAASTAGATIEGAATGVRRGRTRQSHDPTQAGLPFEPR